MSDEMNAELARVATQVTPEVGQFLADVSGSGRFELGALVGDEVRMFRFKRHLRHATRAKEMLDEAGLTAEQVPFRTLVPLIEAASLEDDDEMTEQWSALLANAAGEERPVPPSFPSILAQLEPVDARLLHMLYKLHATAAPEVRDHLGVGYKGAGALLGLSEAQWRSHTDNLLRLRLVFDAGLKGPSNETIGLTQFGREFVLACMPPSFEEPAITIHTREQLDEIVAKNKERWESAESPGGRAVDSAPSGDADPPA